MKNPSRIPSALLLAALLAAPALADLSAGTPVNSLPANLPDPGRYYLTGNLTAASGNGIQILNNDIELDLCGFTITNTDEGAIAILDAGFRNVRVKNGTIVGWDQAVDVGEGATVSHLEIRGCVRGVNTGDDSLVEHCRVVLGGTGAFTLGRDSILRDCHGEVSSTSSSPVVLGANVRAQRVTIEGGRFGVSTGAGAVLEACAASKFEQSGFSIGAFGTALSCRASEPNSESTAVGFALADQARAVDCVASDLETGFSNTKGAQIRAAQVRDCKVGIQVGEAARVEGCTVSGSFQKGIWVQGRGSSVARCTVFGSPGDGVVFSDDAGSIARCLVFDNQGSGIVLAGTGVAESNVSTGNGGAGLRCLGDTNRVLANTLDGNQVGLEVQGIHNLLQGNRTTNNPGGDFVLAPKNPAGPFLLTSGWIQGSIPQANFATPLF